MSATTVLTRIKNKHATEEVWNTSTLVPFEGELIVYDVDDTHTAPRFKIGDGTRTVKNLPFTTNVFVQESIPENAPNGSIWIDTSEVGALNAEGVSF